MRQLTLSLGLACTAAITACLPTPVVAQGIPQPGAFAAITMFSGSGCATGVQWGVGTMQLACVPDGRTQSAFASNVGGVLRASASTSVIGNYQGYAQGRAVWTDQLTFLGGAVPQQAVFGFQMRGLLSVSTDSRGGSNSAAEALFNAYVQPFGSWGGSSNSGQLNSRITAQNGQQVTLPVASPLPLPVSLAGISIGDALTVGMDLSVGTNPSNNSFITPGLTASADALFGNSAGLAFLQFLDASNQDITSQVQWQWTYGVQFLPPVPEPGSAGLLALGLVGLMLRQRWRRAASAQG